MYTRATGFKKKKNYISIAPPDGANAVLDTECLQS